MTGRRDRLTAWGLGLALIALGWPALAEAPERAARPMARPAPAAPAVVTPPPLPGMVALAPLPVPVSLRSFVPDATLAALRRPVARPGAAPAALPQAAGAPLGLPAALLAYAPDAGAAALPRPTARPEAAVSVATSAPWAAVAHDGPRPRQRRAAPPQVAAAAVMPMAALPERLVAMLRPEPRPANLARRAAAAAAAVQQRSAPERVEPVAAIRPAPGAAPQSSRRGGICGNPAIQGEVLAPIAGRVQGCGIASPVRVTAIGTIKLSQAATMDCDTARALHAWVEKGLKPAIGATGGGVAGLQVAGHYVCRTRNHRAGARISEHGKGRAIDISGIALANGQRLSILRDWRGPHGPKLRLAHRAACGIFGTILGPGSDGMHEDHLHFDTARHRNGAYCR